jgi:hypothetical protein
VATRSPPARRIAALVVGLVAAAATARADGVQPAGARTTASLGLTRGPGGEACITAKELAQRVEARLGHATFVSAARAELFVDAKLERARRGWRATVTASRADGARVGVRALASPAADCRGLDADLVLVIALVIDPLAEERPAPPPPPEIRTVYVAAPPPRWAFEARLGAAVLGRRLPAAALAIEGAIAAEPPGAWPIELGVIASRPSDADADAAGPGARVRLVLGTVAVCPSVLARARTRLQLCAGGAAGALTFEPHGLAPAAGGRHATGELFARVRAGVRLAGPLHGALELGASAPLTRVALHYDALDPETLRVVRQDLYREPAVAWLAALGVGVQFP